MLPQNTTKPRKEDIKLAKSSVRTSKVIELLKEKRTILAAQCAKKTMEDDKEVVTTCSRADGVHCGVYAYPEAKWRNGDCPMADGFLRSEIVEETQKGKVRVGQQKQKKKARR